MRAAVKLWAVHAAWRWLRQADQSCRIRAAGASGVRRRRERAGQQV